MADTSLNENRLGILVWQTSNLWQSKIRQILKNSDLTFNEYLILETLYKSIDRSVVSQKINLLEEKKLLIRSQPKDKRSYSLSLTDSGFELVESFIRNVEKQESLMFDKLSSEIFNFTNSLKLILGKKIRIKVKLND